MQNPLNNAQSAHYIHYERSSLKSKDRKRILISLCRSWRPRDNSSLCATYPHMYACGCHTKKRKRLIRKRPSGEPSSPPYTVHIMNDLSFSFLAGFKLRRQHWCFLLLLFLIVIIGLIVGLSRSGHPVSILNSPQLQQAAIAQLLREVPLVDG